MDIIIIAVVCVTAAVISKVIQPTNRELSAVISIAAVVVVVASIIGSISDVIYSLKGAADASGVGSEYILIAFKALGICYVGEIASSCCRDCGETALGGVVDISSRIAIAIICIPLVESFIDVVKNILEI